MTVVRAGGTPLYTGVPLSAKHTKHDSVNVDQGAVHIDADHAEGVMRIQHDRNDGVDILSATDTATGTKTMRLDSAGVIHANNVVTSTGANLDTVKTAVETNSTYIMSNDGDIATINTQLVTISDILTIANNKLNDATATDDGNSDNFVLRDKETGTEINNFHVTASSTHYTPAYPPPGLHFDLGTCDDSLDLLGQGQLGYQPYTPGGTAIVSRTFSFGRAVPVTGETRENADEKRDGLLIEDDAVGNSCEIMCSNALPTLRLIGAKATQTSGGFTMPICPVIDVQDGSSKTQFAVYDDGFVVQRGHQDTDPDALNSGHFSSLVAGDGSVYIGSCRLSYDRAASKLLLMRLKNQIPLYLAAAGVTSGQVPVAYNLMSVHSWVALGRTLLSNERLTVRDVFPSASADWEQVSVEADAFLAERLTPASGTAFKVLRVQQVLAGDQSVWLGNKLHISDTASRAQMQIRKDTIPVYLSSAPYNVVLADVQALGKTLATATLDDWISLSVAAGGSDQLDVIFPVVNQSSDFELRTTLNELLIKPQDAVQNSGVTINQPSAGHPCLFFEGNSTTPGGGYGLIQFGDQSAAKSMIYSSSADGHLHLDHFSGKIQVDAAALDLSAGTALTRAGVPIGGGASAEATELVYVDSSYGGGGSDGSVLKPYTALTTALAAHLVEASTISCCFQLAPGTYEMYKDASAYERERGF